MATSLKTTIETTVTVPAVQLTLNEDEAQFVADLLSCVGGSPDRSRRKHSRDLLRALSAVGVHYNAEPYTGKAADMQPGSAVYFTDTE